MPRLSYGSVKRKGSRPLNASALSLDGYVEPAPITQGGSSSEPISHHNIPEETKPIFTSSQEIHDRAQCIADYMLYQARKQDTGHNPFDRFVRL